jgi:hypothetical protein
VSNTLVVYDASNTLVVSAPGPQGPAGVGGGGGVTDGDKGDVTVSNSGATWTVDAQAVTFAKLQNVTGPALLGRQAATAGSAEAITLGSGLSIDGSKQLTITASYAQQSVTMSAGTGLTGGGDLSANRSFAVAYGSTAGSACEGNDARLSDARTPTAHNHSASEVTSGTLDIGRIPTGTTSSTVCIGNDSRLSDARTPTAHTHDATDAYVGEIETPAARTYTIDLNAATARTISALYFITSAGTVDVTVKNGANTVYTADGLGTTKTSVTSGLSNTSVSAGGSILLTIDAVSTPADLSFAIYYTRTTGAIT